MFPLQIIKELKRLKYFCYIQNQFSNFLFFLTHGIIIWLGLYYIFFGFRELPMKNLTTFILLLSCWQFSCSYDLRPNSNLKHLKNTIVITDFWYFCTKASNVTDRIKLSGHWNRNKNFYSLQFFVFKPIFT